MAENTIGILMIGILIGNAMMFVAFTVVDRYRRLRAMQTAKRMLDGTAGGVA